MSIARFVGGPAAGQEIEVHGPRHLVTEPYPFVDYKQGDLAEYLDVPPRTEYEIRQFRFNSGHRHNYAAVTGVPDVQVLNQLWHGYQRTESLRNQVTELQEQLRRARHELWRYTFKDQFGHFPAGAEKQ